VTTSAVVTSAQGGFRGAFDKLRGGGRLHRLLRAAGRCQRAALPVPNPPSASSSWAAAAVRPLVDRQAAAKVNCLLRARSGFNSSAAISSTPARAPALQPSRDLVGKVDGQGHVGSVEPVRLSMDPVQGSPVGPEFWEPSWEPFPTDGREGRWRSADARPLSSDRVWTVADATGRGLLTPGSQGWGFESLRACHRSPCIEGLGPGPPRRVLGCSVGTSLV
jgi:hypothetical protein